MQRRAFLARSAALVAGATGLAGCLDTFGDLTGDGTRLARLSADNEDDETHTVDVRVEWGGKRAHDSTHVLDANTDDPNARTSAWPEQSWPDEPGEFTVSARVDGGEWRQATPDDWDDPDCLSLIAVVDAQARLAFFGSTNPNACSSDGFGGDTANETQTQS